MSAENLFVQSLILTVIGMLVVYVFLTVMIGVMNALAWLVKVLEKFFPQQEPQTAAAGADNALVAVAIAAAKKIQGK